MNTNILYDIYKLNHETEGKALAVAFRKGKAAFEAVAEVLYAEDVEAAQ